MNACRIAAMDWGVTGHQGLTLFHLPAQRKRFLWDQTCLWGGERVFTAGVEGVFGFRGCFECEKWLRLS